MQTCVCVVDLRIFKDERLFLQLVNLSCSSYRANVGCVKRGEDSFLVGAGLVRLRVGRYREVVRLQSACMRVYSTADLIDTRFTSRKDWK